MRRFALLFSILAVQATAQPLPLSLPVHFGSAADPLESTFDPLRPGSGRVAAYGGPSYIGVTWRVAAGLEAEGFVGPLAVGLQGGLRVGLDGIYEPDVDEVYDLLRLVRYARLNPTPRVPLYARLGPLTRVTLGQGDLVRDFATTAAWDERTVGVELATAFNRFEAAVFAADVRMDRLVGGRIALRPLPAGTRGRAPLGLPTLVVGASAVHDLGLDGPHRTTAVSVDAAFDLLAVGDLRLAPFVSYARYLEYGNGLTIGASFGSPALADLLMVYASAALSRSSEQFIPGYFNAFYPVSNPEATIINSDHYFRDRRFLVPAGTPLSEAQGGTALTVELSGAVLGVFEYSQFYRHDFGGSTGAFGIRLSVTPELGRDLRFAFDLQRQGITGLGALFSDLTDEAVLTFHVDYRFSGPFFIFLRSRYGYTQLGDLPDGRAAYLVERRFEPMVGVALVR